MILVIRTFILMLACGLISCEKPQREDVILAGKIRSKAANSLTQEGNLYCEGAGGAMMNEIEKINLVFRSTEKMDLKEARKIFVKIAAKVLKDFNEDIRIRKYMICHPFTDKNIEIDLSFTSDRGERAPSPYVALIGQAKGKIYYLTYNKTLKDFEDLHRETFEEAVKIVEESTGKKVDFGY